MEGIAGAYGYVDVPVVKKSLLRLGHRGVGRSEVLSNERAVLAARTLPCGPRGKTSPLAQEGAVVVASDSYLFNRDFLRSTIAPSVDPKASDQELVLAMYKAIGTRMFGYMDGAFAVAIMDHGKVILARDEYGMKPLYLSGSKRAGHFSSEIKSQIVFGEDFSPFPPGKVFVSEEGFKDIVRKSVEWSNGALPKKAPDRFRELLARSVRSFADDVNPKFNVLLSGGIDSSVVAAAAAGLPANLKTVCVGVEGSEDIGMARLVSEQLGTDHKEKVFGVEDMLRVLRKAILSAETFDYPLVRSCIPNFMAANLFDDASRVTLCGEGGDEVFAGYDFLQKIKNVNSLRKERIGLLASGHMTGFQRVDRMTASASLDGRMPIMSSDIISFGLGLPRSELIGSNANKSKLVMRKAFRDLLPSKVVWRRKMRFSEGAGSITALVRFVDRAIADAEFERERKRLPKGRIRTKEELFYFRIFEELFPSSSAIAAVGFTPRP